MGAVQARSLRARIITTMAFTIRRPAAPITVAIGKFGTFHGMAELLGKASWFGFVNSNSSSDASSPVDMSSSPAADEEDSPTMTSSLYGLNRAIMLAIGISVGGSPLCAQTSDEPDPLSQLTSPFICRSAPTTVEDSAAFVFSFLDRPASNATRRILFAFDSVGSPLYSTISLSIAGGEENRMVLLIIRLAPWSGGSRIRTSDGHADTLGALVPEGGRSEPSTASGTLSVRDIARVRDLGVWLWPRRCPTEINRKATDTRISSWRGGERQAAGLGATPRANAVQLG